MEKKELSEDPYRFVVLTVFLLGGFANSFPAQTFAGINYTVQTVFKINDFLVTLNSIQISIIHLVFAYPCNWMLNKYGMRNSFFLSGGLVVAGTWLRTLLSEGNMIWCLIGSVLCAIGGIFIMNTPSKVGLNWFRNDMVPVVTIAGIFMNQFSTSIGASVPGFFLSPSSSQEEILRLFRIIGVIVTIPFILLFIFFRQKPKIPPSQAAEVAFNKKRQRYMVLMKKLFTNVGYLKLAITMALTFGMLSAFLSIFDQCLVGLGYIQNSGRIISTFGIAGLIGGILGNIFFSFVIKKTKAIKKIGCFAILLTLISYATLAILIISKVENVYLISVVGLFYSFFLLPVASIIVLFASELAFPLEASSITGYIFASSQIVGFVMGIVFTQILNKTYFRSILVLIIIACSILLGLLIFLSITEDLKKQRYEQGIIDKESIQPLSIKESTSEIMSINNQLQNDKNTDQKYVPLLK